MAALGAWLFGTAVALFFLLVGLLMALAVVKGRRRRRLWRWIVRPLFWLWIVTAVGWLALSPVWRADHPVEEPETFEVSTIRDYRADFTVREDGRLDATETITATFPPYRHGIFRFWDLTDQSDPHARLVPRSIEVTRDGVEEPFELLEGEAEDLEIELRSLDAEKAVADVAADEERPAAFPRDRFSQGPGYVETQRSPRTAELPLLPAPMCSG